MIASVLFADTSPAATFFICRSAPLLPTDTCIPARSAPESTPLDQEYDLPAIVAEDCAVAAEDVSVPLPIATAFFLSDTASLPIAIALSAEAVTSRPIAIL